MKSIFSFVALAIGLTIPSFATHLVGANMNIESQSVTSLTYNYTLFVYLDDQSTVATEGIVDFGDGNTLDIANLSPVKTIHQNGLEKNTFTFQHTYAAFGTYIVTFMDQSGFTGALNIEGISIPLFITYTLTADPLLGINNSPVSTITPNLFGASGLPYLLNFSLYDADGDSLSYTLIDPQEAADQTAENYTMPNDEEHYADGTYNSSNAAGDGPPTLGFDSSSGTLIWDTPGFAGKYLIAILTEEWRSINDEWVKIGAGTSAFLLEILEGDFQAPSITIPEATCIVPETQLSADVVVADPNGLPISLSTGGYLSDMANNDIVTTPDLESEQSSPTTFELAWESDCSETRADPYTVFFQATNLPTDSDPALSTYASWNITVAGAPEGLKGVVNEIGEVTLSWSPYLCNIAESISIYRVVDNFLFPQVGCEGGIPNVENTQLVATVSPSELSYVDSGLDDGTVYCYRLVANFMASIGGESLASEQMCIQPDQTNLVTGIPFRDREAKLFDIYPNPANKTLHIQQKRKSLVPLTIRLLSLNGQLVRQWQAPTNSTNTQIALIDIVAGIYLVRLQMGNRIINRRLIVK